MPFGQIDLIPDGMPVFLLPLLMLLEVVAFVAAVALLGFWTTMGLSVLSFVIGGLILHHQGLKTAERFITSLEFGRPPLAETWDGVCLNLAGFLFLLPGLVSDALAVGLLIPAVRRALYRLFARRGDYRYDPDAMKPDSGPVIEGTYRDVTPPG